VLSNPKSGEPAAKLADLSEEPARFVNLEVVSKTTTARCAGRPALVPPASTRRRR
jgi:hypothetical protein